MNDKRISDILSRSVVWEWVLLKAQGKELEASACIQNLSKGYEPGTLGHDIPEMAFREEENIFVKSLAEELRTSTAGDLFFEGLKENVLDVLYESRLMHSIINEIGNIAIEA